jgi:hypothetical protein
MIKWLLLIAVAACFGAGCNPTRRIDMKNESGDEATITFHIKEDSLLQSPFFLNNAEKSRFRMESRHPYNLIKLSFGVGPWTRNYLRDVIDDLEKMEIKTAGSEIVLETPESIENFLWSRRAGLTKRKIRITLTDPILQDTTLRHSASSN